MKNDTFNNIILLKREKKYDKAIKLAKSAFRKTKDNCFNNEIYSCLYSQGKIDEANKILKKMVKIEPYNHDLFAKIANNYFLSGNLKQSLKYYKLALEKNPSSVQYLYAIGYIYHTLKNAKKAFDCYNGILKLNPSYAPALNNIGLLYLEAKNYDGAIKFFKSAISKSSRHPEAYHHMGVIHRIYNKDEELSELYLKKAIRLDPKYVDNYYQLALTYEYFKKPKKAIETLEKCMQINPKYKPAKNLLKKLK